jgi:hypothetical protein
VGALHRRVVDQDIELAELLHSVVDHRLAEGFIRNVPRHQDRAATGLFNLVLGLLRVVMLLKIGDQDVRTLTRERDRHGATDSRVRTGNDRRFARQSAMPVVAVLTVIRFGRHVSRLAGRRLALFRMRRLWAIVVVRHGLVLFLIYSAATGGSSVLSRRARVP